jgi:hypothetical protein
MTPGARVDTPLLSAPLLTGPLAQLLAVGAALVVLGWVAPPLHRAAGGAVWFALIGLWAVGAFTGARLAARCDTRLTLLIVLAAAVLMRLPLLLEPPYLSSDIYRYVWDGRVQRAGLNPYLHIPAAPELAHLRDSTVFPGINRADYAPTIYMPAAQLLFRAANVLSDSVAGMKLALLAFEALAVAALIALLPRFGLPAASVAAYAWHPLPVWEIAGNGHVDAALLGLMLASFALYLRGRPLGAGALAAVAALVKPTALLLFPVYWRRWDWRLPAVLVFVVVLLYLPYLSAGSRVLGFLAGYVAEEGLSSGGGFRYLAMLERIVGPVPRGGLVYVAIAGALLGAVALRIGWREARTPQSALASLALLLTLFLLLLTPHYPWYYLALGPLLALLPGALTPWVLMTGSFVLYDVIEGDRLPSFALREGLLHIAALVAFAHDMLRRRMSAA